jgi:hypothetical protein
MVYINLFHGRKDPFADMDGFGEAGPIIGPLHFSWTYKSLKVHACDDKVDDWGDMHSLWLFNDLVFFDGMYYGDFEIWTPDDPKILDNLDRIVDWDAFVEKHYATIPVNAQVNRNASGNILSVVEQTSKIWRCY